MLNERLIDAAIAVLEGAGGRLDITNLNKSLFYFDLVMLRDVGATFTKAEYVALPRGPVVQDYRTDLVEALVRGGFATQGNDGMAKPVVLKDERPHRFATDHVSVIDVARKMGAKAKTRTATQLSEYSHENLGWKRAITRGNGTPINMLLAMQQIAEVDPWLSEKKWTDAEFIVVADGSTAEPW